MHRLTILFILAITIITVAQCRIVFAEEKIYRNSVYNFSFKYDDTLVQSKTIDPPPNANHGIGFDLFGGEKIDVMGDGYHVKDYYNTLLTDCKVKKIETAHFQKYYICKDAIYAVTDAWFGERGLYYSVVYRDYNVQSNGIIFFKNILRTFVFLREE